MNLFVYTFYKPTLQFGLILEMKLALHTYGLKRITLAEVCLDVLGEIVDKS